jgi:hypothetical protein
MSSDEIKTMIAALPARLTYWIADLVQRADEAGITRDELIDTWQNLLEAKRRREKGEDIYVQTPDGALLEDVEDIVAWIDDRRDTRLRAVHRHDREWRARQRERGRKLTTAERRENYKRAAQQLRAEVDRLTRAHPSWPRRAIARQLLPVGQRQDAKKINAMAIRIARLPK